jgi:hypothetical protein
VRLLRTERVAIEAALRLAQAKFGDRLKLSGSAEFQGRAARIAAEAGLNVRFDNKQAEQVREQRAAELASQRTAGQRYVEQQKDRRPIRPRASGQNVSDAQNRDEGKAGPAKRRQGHRTVTGGTVIGSVTPACRESAATIRTPRQLRRYARAAPGSFLRRLRD